MLELRQELEGWRIISSDFVQLLNCILL